MPVEGRLHFRELIQSHLTRLSPAARQLAQRCAVVGHRLSPIQLSALTGDEPGLLAALEELLEASFLRDLEDGTLQWAGEALRGAVMATLRPFQRSALERQLEAAFDARAGTTRLFRSG
jgi:hypothetical protein